MSAFKQKLARLGATAGVLAASTAAIMAAGGVTAGSASAACSATIMKGQGSSLQKIAQESIWNKYVTVGACAVEAGSGPGPFQKPEYTSTSSGKGLGQWGFTAAGGTVNTEWKYIGTDDGPSETQMTNAREAAGGKATRHVVVVPVTQTAIAIVYNPPTGCSMPGSPAHITNANLEKAFDGEATAWSTIGAVETATPANKCPGTKNLTRVVREEGSGTTYQFKNYLAEVNKLVHSGTEAAPCGTEPKWSELEEIGTGEEPNKKWPSCGTIAVERKAGGGKVAEWVANHPGTIGYAALPDAKNNSAGVLAVQNNGINGSPTYGNPVKGSEEANCSNTEYDVPEEANVTKKPAATGLDVDWSKVFGGNPSITGTAYPICTLTYDLGWKEYSLAGFGAGVGESVQNYYKYILSHGVGATPHYYANLPAKVGAEETNNVQKAAEFSVKKIG